MGNEGIPDFSWLEGPFLSWAGQMRVTTTARTMYIIRRLLSSLLKLMDLKL